MESDSVRSQPGRVTVGLLLLLPCVWAGFVFASLSIALAAGPFGRIYENLAALACFPFAYIGLFWTTRIIFYRTALSRSDRRWREHSYALGATLLWLLAVAGAILPQQTLEQARGIRPGSEQARP